MDEMLNRLIDLVTSTAPELWVAALEQVKAMAMQKILWMAAWLVASGICVFLANLSWEETGGDVDHDIFFAVLFFIALSVGCLVAFAIQTAGLIGLVMAPKYHAIEQLMQLAK